MNFEEQFNKTKPTIRWYARCFSNSTNIPYEEYESALYEEFGDKFDAYDGRITFTAFIKPILRQRALRVADKRRKEGKFYNNLYYIDGESDEDGNPTFELAGEVNIEEEVVSPKKKCEDKRQLISALLSSADELTTAIVTQMLKNPDASRKSIADRLGIHHQVLTRKLSKLAKNYDQSRFGDLSQYLAV